MPASSAIPFVQTATAAPCGAISADLGISVYSNAVAQLCREGGTAGTEPLDQMDMSEFDPGIFAVFGFDHQPLYNVAGDWTVRINLASTTNNGQWTQTHIVAVDVSTCAVGQTIGSRTGASVVLDTVGVASMTVTTTAQAVAASRRIYVVCVCANSDGFMEITPDQTISTTLLPGGPYHVAATQIYAPGAIASQVYVPGSRASEIYAPGARAAQCPSL